MSDINVRVPTSDTTNVRVGTEDAIKVLSSGGGGSSGGSLGGLSDVDISGGLSNGMVLVYNNTTAKWTATLELTPGPETTQDLNINGGSW
tara:strand:- start:2788 stop:3057 length:270 start_codon:yes stop_codon:yes gene_type:complete